MNEIKLIKSNKKRTNNLPQGSSITIDQIPKYCYFKPESEKRGCKFIIDNHPKLLETGKKIWTTSESKKISIENKFNELINKLSEFNL